MKDKEKKHHKKKYRKTECHLFPPIVGLIVSTIGREGKSERGLFQKEKKPALRPGSSSLDHVPEKKPFFDKPLGGVRNFHSRLPKGRCAGVSPRSRFRRFQQLPLPPKSVQKKLYENTITGAAPGF